MFIDEQAMNDERRAQNHEKRPMTLNFLRSSLRAHRSALSSAALAVLLLATPPALACPFCKDGVSTDKPAATKTAESASLDFNTSIYAMLAGLIGVSGFTGVAMYRAAKESAER